MLAWGGSARDAQRGLDHDGGDEDAAGRDERVRGGVRPRRGPEQVRRRVGLPRVRVQQVLRGLVKLYRARLKGFGRAFE